MGVLNFHPPKSKLAHIHIHTPHRHQASTHRPLPHLLHRHAEIDGGGPPAPLARGRRRWCAERLSDACRYGASPWRAGFAARGRAAAHDRRASPPTMGRTCPSAGLWPVRTLCVLALCVHVAPSMYVAALRTFARPCCVLGVLVQFCRRTYLDSESARTTPPTAPAFSLGVSTPVRPCPARLHLVRLRLVRLRPARSRPVRPNRHHAIAHVCSVRARAMRVLVACVCALRAGALCLCRDLPMYTLLSR